MDSRFTRPVRAAAQLRGVSEESIERLFRSARVAIRLEEPFAEIADARETFLLTVNQCLRFCPNVSVYVPQGEEDLVHYCGLLKTAIHGQDYNFAGQNQIHFAKADAIINIGTEILSGLPATTVNSSGWVARIAGIDAGKFLTWNNGPSNVLGAHAAACLGSWQAFFHLLGKRPLTDSFELSLFNYKTGDVGSLDSGPQLPRESLRLDGWLIGCGGVANGWAYTIKRLPINGRLTVVDRQLLRDENLGPYVAADQSHLRKPKVDLIREILHPSIKVTPFLDEWEFFKIRLEHGLAVPSLVVVGVDNVETRHSVQRLWPKHLIDIGASGLTSQVLVTGSDSPDLCLLGALSPDPYELTYSQRISQQTGLRIDRILKEPTAQISEQDVAAAPVEMRHELDLARQAGQLLCGYILSHDVESSSAGDFAPAVPFVTSFSGVVAAAETMKWLMRSEYLQSLHFQYSFQSGRMRALQMKCLADCECYEHSRE